MSDPILAGGDDRDHPPPATSRGDTDGDLDQLSLVTRVIHAIVDAGLMYVDGDSLRRLSGLACLNHYGFSPDCVKCEQLMNLAAVELAKQLGPDLGNTE